VRAGEPEITQATNDLRIFYGMTINAREVLPYEKVGDVRLKIGIKPLKETNLRGARTLFQP